MPITKQKCLQALGDLFEDPQPVEVRMSKHQLWSLLSAVQLACRHPNFNGPTRHIVVAAASQLAAVMTADNPVLQEMFERGWDPNGAQIEEEEDEDKGFSE